MTQIPTMLGTMLRYQESLNDVFDPAWRTNRHKYLRAAAVECAELMDDYAHEGLHSAVVVCGKLIEALGYKWWRKVPERNEGMLTLELMALGRHLCSAFEIREAFEKAWACETGTVHLDGLQRPLQGLSTLEKLDYLMGLAASGHPNLELYRSICADITPGIDYQLASQTRPCYPVPPKRQPDIKQMMLEVVDIAHFVLSEVARQSNESEAAQVALLKAWDDTSREIIYGGVSFNLDQLESRERMSLMVALCCSGRVNFELFRCLMADVGLSFRAMYRMYAAKNVLNLLRQHEGDKQGTYIKIWQGREDNEYLAELMESWTEEEGMDSLYSRLKQCYLDMTSF